MAFILDLIDQLLTPRERLLLVADLALKGSLLVLFALVVARLLRGASAATRHAVWSAAILAHLALPFLVASVPEVPVPVLPAAGEMTPAPATSDPASPRLDGSSPSMQGPNELVEPLPETPIRRVADIGTAILAPSAARPPLTTATVPWGAVLLGIYGLGVLLILLRLALGTIQVARLARLAERVTDGRLLSLAQRVADELDLQRGFTILRGDRLSVPVTWGVVNPVVLLPEDSHGWSPERARLVLLHELAHVKRHDVLVQLIAQIVFAFFWFNPLVWVALRALKNESERAADDCVLRAGTEPSTYVHDLLAMVRGMRRAMGPAFATLAMARPSEFEGRMLAILDARASRRAAGRLAGSAAMLATLALAIPLAAMRPVPADAPRAADPDGGDATPAGGAAPDAPRIALVARQQAESLRAARSDAESVSVRRRRDRLQPVLVNAGQPSQPDQPDQQHATPQPEMDLDFVPPHPGPVVTPAPARGADTGAGRAAAVAPLVATLRDDDPSVRLAAVRALSQIQDPRAVEALIRALREDEDADVRETAAWALGEIEDRRAVAALSSAVREDKVAGVRQKAAWALGQIEDATAAEALGAALKDENVEVRRTAMWALGQLESKTSVRFILPALRDEDAEMRKQAAWALGQIESTEATEPLIAMLQDREGKVRDMAAWALGQIEDPRAVPALAAMLKDASPEVKKKAIWAIGQIEPEKAPQGLIDALKDSDRGTRKQAAWALGQIEDPAAITALLAATKDTESEVRKTAIWAVMQIGGDQSVDALIELLKDSDPEVRKMAAQALGKH